jgi:hypothetical protein
MPRRRAPRFSAVVGRRRLDDATCAGSRRRLDVRAAERLVALELPHNSRRRHAGCRVRRRGGALSDDGRARRRRDCRGRHRRRGHGGRSGFFVAARTEQADRQQGKSGPDHGISPEQEVGGAIEPRYRTARRRRLFPLRARSAGWSFLAIWLSTIWPQPIATNLLMASKCRGAPRPPPGGETCVDAASKAVWCGSAASTRRRRRIRFRWGLVNRRTNRFADEDAPYGCEQYMESCEPRATPDFAAVKRLLDERFGNSSDDIDHEDIFGWGRT